MLDDTLDKPNDIALLDFQWSSAPSYHDIWTGFLLAYLHGVLHDEPDLLATRGSVAFMNAPLMTWQTHSPHARVYPVPFFIMAAETSRIYGSLICSVYYER